jgi:hypothetical protein
MDGDNSGDQIKVGDIHRSQAIVIGRGSSVRVIGNNVSGDVRVDAAALQSALHALHDALGDADLSREQRIQAQTATGNAYNGVTEESVESGTVTSNLEKVGETLKQANVAIEQGTSLGESVRHLAALVGPLVGGAGAVAAWFGLPL